MGTRLFHSSEWGRGGTRTKNGGKERSSAKKEDDFIEGLVKVNFCQDPRRSEGAERGDLGYHQRDRRRGERGYFAKKGLSDHTRIVGRGRSNSDGIPRTVLSTPRRYRESAELRRADE